MDIPLAGGAGVALLLGPLQFRPQLRQRWPKIHRWTGQVYVAACLVGGSSGLVLAAGTSAGALAQWGFSAVGVLWLYMTAQGWRTAVAGQWPEHQRWMVRSFALTFAAVTLRIYLPLALWQGLSFNNAYRIIAWLSWVPNAILAEVYLRSNVALWPQLPANDRKPHAVQTLNAPVQNTAMKFTNNLTQP